MVSRRSFLGSIPVAAAAVGSGPDRAETRPAASPTDSTDPTPPPERFDPWVEVDPASLIHNAGVVTALAGDRPVLAVIKNNAYGLGLTRVARTLEPLDHIAGFAVVKTDAALRLREAGVRKPVLLMGQFADADAADLIRRDIRLSLCTDGSGARAAQAAQRVGRPARVHLYLDTGLGRMGIPAQRAQRWLEILPRTHLEVEGMFMAFTEDEAFDPEQLDRFLAVTRTAAGLGIDPGLRHAASSHAVFHFPDARLDLVRPGMALYGAFPDDAAAERRIAAARGLQLRPAVRLRARVVRVEHLRPGDAVSYGRAYVAARPVWTATLPVGHADGVPRRAVNGARVLIGDATFPVIGAVSASHTIIELGEAPVVSVGDTATFLGPDHPDIHPNRVAAATGTSVYDLLMHLSPSLPRVYARG